MMDIKNIEELRKESGGYTRLLYHCDYWDGPHDGMMLWEGKRAWFASDGEDVLEERVPFTPKELEEWKGVCENKKWDFNPEDCFESVWRRHFNVYEIPEDLIQKIEAEHNLFRLYVGTHTDYNSEGKRDPGASLDYKSIGGLMPQEMHGKFYDREREKIDLDLSNRRIIGRFKC